MILIAVIVANLSTFLKGSLGILLSNQTFNTSTLLFHHSIIDSFYNATKGPLHNQTLLTEKFDLIKRWIGCQMVWLSWISNLHYWNVCAKRLLGKKVWIRCNLFFVFKYMLSNDIDTSEFELHSYSGFILVLIICLITWEI